MSPFSLTHNDMSVRKPSCKRRRLTSYPDRPTLAAAKGEGNAQAHVMNVRRIFSEAGGRLVCNSCQRALSARPESVIICPRCASATCPICSRTCTTPPESYPPTPNLTHSPTPTSSPNPNLRRTALGLTSLNAIPLINFGIQNNSVNKRRKQDDGNGEGDLDLDVHNSTRHGCGRVFCKGCCEESWQSGSSTCLDCYERI